MFIKGFQCVEAYSKISGPNACQVKAHSKPWIVSLRRKRSIWPNFQWCAGTIIGSKLVLTAAHCICYPWEISPNCSYWKNTTVIAGDYSKEEIDEGEQQIDVKYGDVHKKYMGRGKIPSIFFLIFICCKTNGNV